MNKDNEKIFRAQLDAADFTGNYTKPNELIKSDEKKNWPDELPDGLHHLYLYLLRKNISYLTRTVNIIVHSSPKRIRGSENLIPVSRMNTILELIETGINAYHCPLAAELLPIAETVKILLCAIKDYASDDIGDNFLTGQDEWEEFIEGELLIYTSNLGLFLKDLMLFWTKADLKIRSMISSGEIILKPLEPIEGDDIDKLMQTIFEEQPETIWSDSGLKDEFAEKGYRTTRQTISARPLYKAYRKEIPKRLKEMRLGKMQIDTERKVHYSRDKKASDCYDDE